MRMHGWVLLLLLLVLLQQVVVVVLRPVHRGRLHVTSHVFPGRQPVALLLCTQVLTSCNTERENKMADCQNPNPQNFWKNLPDIMKTAPALAP